MKKLILILSFITVQVCASKGTVDSLLLKAQSLYSTNLDSVFTTLKKAYDISIESKNLEKEAAVAYEMISYASRTGNFELGKFYFDKTLISVKTNVKLQSDLLIIFSDLQTTSGVLDGAVESLMKAEKVSDSLDLKAQKYRILQMLSNVFLLKKEYNKALDYAKFSLVASKKLKDSYKIGWSYARIANVLLEMKNLEEAQFNYENSIKEFDLVNDKNSKAQMINNLGLVKQKQGQYNEAEKNFLSAYVIAKEIKFFVFQVYIEQELGDLYRLKKDYTKAKKYFDLALANEKDANYPTLTQSLYYNIHDFYKETGDCNKALLFFEKYSVLTDSLTQINQDQRILETETKFRTKEKQKEIEFLNKENELQQSQIKKRNIILILSIVVIVIIGGLVVVIYQSRKKEQINNKALAQKNIEIEHQKKEILDSITYAKRIQDATLGNPDKIKQFYSESAILFQPKDVLSGDFYWFEKKENNFMFSVADCTGHGVPGAMMSMIGNNGLNEAVKGGISNPGEILNYLSSHVSTNFNKKDFDVKDGMDIAFCSLNTLTGKLIYAGALNSVFISKVNGEFIELKTDKNYIGQPNSTYSDSEFQLEKGDTVYIMSDGYVDQFGGEKNKKFKLSSFRESAKNIAKFDVDSKVAVLKSVINNWKKNVEQTDDICLIAVTF